MCLHPPLPLRKEKPIPAGMGIGSLPHTSRSSLRGPLNRTVRRPGVNKTITQWCNNEESKAYENILKS